VRFVKSSKGLAVSSNRRIPTTTLKRKSQQMYPTGAVRRPILGKCGTEIHPGIWYIASSRPAAVHACSKSKTNETKPKRLLGTTQILRNYIRYSRKMVSRVAKSIKKKTPGVNADDVNAYMRYRLLSRNRMSYRQNAAIARRRQMLLSSIRQNRSRRCSLEVTSRPRKAWHTLGNGPSRNFPYLRRCCTVAASACSVVEVALETLRLLVRYRAPSCMLPSCRLERCCSTGGRCMRRKSKAD
jgi:hypothetical protein